MKDLKGNSLPFSSPAPASRKTPSKSREQKVSHAPPTVSSAEVSDAPESGKSQDGEGIKLTFISRGGLNFQTANVNCTFFVHLFTLYVFF